MALCEVCYQSRDAHKHKNKIKNSASAVNLKNIKPAAMQVQIQRIQQQKPKQQQCRVTVEEI